MANFIPKIEYTHPVDGLTIIDFDLPPQGDPLKENNQTVGRETRSSSGKTQYQRNYLDISYELDLVFLTKAKIDELQKFFNDHASFGRTFKYYPSNEEVDFFNVIWPGSRKRFRPIRVIASGGDFIYDLTIPIRVEI